MEDFHFPNSVRKMIVGVFGETYAQVKKFLEEKEREGSWREE